MLYYVHMCIPISNLAFPQDCLGHVNIIPGRSKLSVYYGENVIMQGIVSRVLYLGSGLNFMLKIG